MMKFFKQSNRSYILTTVLVLVAIFAVGQEAHAQEGVIINIVSGLLSVIVGFLGWLITLLITAIIYIAQYNNYVDSPVVIKGWVIVRDICNMFFILMLLVIAFGTILRIDNYAIKKALPKLIMAAILINFSKTICGIAIDAASVVMLTFVNGFKDFGGAQLSQILGIEKMLSLARDPSPGTAAVGINPAGVTGWDIVITYLFAFAYLLIVMVVLAAMLGVLVTRMIMLWIYIVLSPIIFISSKVAGTWKASFVQYLVTGPVLAFFIWLSLSTLQSVTSNDPNNVSIALLGGAVQQKISGVGPSEISSTEFFIGYIVAIGLLIGGLIVAQKVGGSAAGAAAKWGFDKINKGAGWAKKTAMRPVKYTAKKAAVGTGTVLAGSAKFADGALFGGAVGRGIGSAKENMTSMAGLTRIKDAMVSYSADKLGTNSLLKLNSKVAQMRQAVGANKEFVDENNVKWKASEGGKGPITTGGESLYTTDAAGNRVRKSAEDIEKLLPKFNGKSVEIDAMKEELAQGVAGWRSNVFSTKASAAKYKLDKEKVDKFRKDYGNLETQSDFQNAFANTTNVHRRQAIALEAKGKNFTVVGAGPNAVKFAEERKSANKKEEYEEKLEEKLKSLADLDFDNLTAATDLKREYENPALGTINRATFDSTNPADMDKLAKKFAIQNEMQKRGVWNDYVESLPDAGAKSRARAEAGAINDINNAELEKITGARQVKLDDINKRESAEQREEFDKVKNLFKYTPSLMKELMEGMVKTRPDLVWDLDNKAHVDAFTGAAKKGKVSLKELKVDRMDPGNLGSFLGLYKDAVGPDRYAAQVADIDKNGSKAFATKISEASLINAARQDAKAKVAAPDSADRTKAEREAQAYRTQVVALSGDLRKAFSKNGILDEVALKKFAQAASAKQLEQVDDSSMDPQIAKLLASQVNSAKVTQLVRNDNNPGLIKKIFEAWRETNNPEGIKAVNIDPTMIINVPAASQNGAIQKVLRELKGAGSADPVMMQKLADVDVTDIGNVDNKRKGSAIFSDINNYPKTKGGGRVASTIVRDEIERLIRGRAW